MRRCYGLTVTTSPRTRALRGYNRGCNGGCYNQLSCYNPRGGCNEPPLLTGGVVTNPPSKHRHATRPPLQPGPNMRSSPGSRLHVGSTSGNLRHRPRSFRSRSHSPRPHSPRSHGPRMHAHRSHDQSAHNQSAHAHSSQARPAHNCRAHASWTQARWAQKDPPKLAGLTLAIDPRSLEPSMLAELTMRTERTRRKRVP
jgi:hypothetical protein